MNQNLSIHGHNTRSKLNFHVAFCITVLFQKNVVNVGIRLYATVPESIKNWLTFFVIIIIIIIIMFMKG